MTDTDYEPGAHYDRVTAAWSLLLGEELHYGVFENGDEDLRTATGALTRRMVDASLLKPGLHVLDVGCGTGAPACHLAETFGVHVMGITTSAVGLDAARARAAERGLAHLVSFELRDGTANEFDDASFDRVWVLESSHLMPARDRLIEECARVLRAGGRMTLCDIVLHREIPFGELRRRTAEFATLRAAFGEARMERMQTYIDLASASGLVVDVTEDLTALTLPTFDRWRANATEHIDAVRETLRADEVDIFVQGASILEGLWREGTMGYGLVSAVSPVA